jgi:hypothetical protein
MLRWVGATSLVPKLPLVAREQFSGRPELLGQTAQRQMTV